MTHPFHSQRGRRLRVLFERRLASGRLLVCNDGASGTVTVPEAATDGLSGVRLEQFLSASPDDRIVVATICSHPDARRAR